MMFLAVSSYYLLVIKFPSKMLLTSLVESNINFRHHDWFDVVKKQVAQTYIERLHRTKKQII